MSINPYQAIGTAVIVPVGGLALAWSAVARASDATTQALSGTATLVAGTYSPTGFMNHVAKKLRTSIYDAICAAAYFTTEPVNAAAVPLKLDLQTAGPSVALGGTLLRLACASTGGALKGAFATTWQSFSLINTTNTWALTGLCRVGETRALTIAAGGFADDGRFQPRWLFIFRSHFRDSGDLRRWPSHVANVYDDGTVAQHDFGTLNIYERTLVLVDQPQHLIGVPWVVGTFSAFGATRNLLALLTVDETLFGTWISSTYKRVDNLVSPVYLKLGRWWARYYQQSPTDTFECFELWPASVIPSSGEPIQATPESEALVEEVRRVGLLFRFDPIDATGETSWVSKAYALRTGANPTPIRRGNGNLFYSVEIPLVLVPNPALAVP